MNEAIKNYEAPQCEVIEMELQAILAESPNSQTVPPPGWVPDTID